MGRDSVPPVTGWPLPVFQSTLPAWGETGWGTAPSASTSHFNPLSPHGERRGMERRTWKRKEFQSTLPAWGETAPGSRTTGSPGHFNPLSPHGERLLHCLHGGHALGISIHSPRMGRDGHLAPHVPEKPLFQSTLPAWGETWRSPARCIPCHFNPLSPHGERRT